MKIVWTLAVLLLFSCRNDEAQSDRPAVGSEKKWSNQQSVEFNQEIHIREELDIEIYLAHHKYLRMTETNTALRYQIVSKDDVSGEYAGDGDVVMIDLKISLLDGSICYETDSIPDQFILGRSDKESGLQEALELMRLNDKAKLILPSYLAHGLLGDSETIPPQSVLIIDVELLNIER